MPAAHTFDHYCSHRHHHGNHRFFYDKLCWLSYRGHLLRLPMQLHGGSCRIERTLLLQKVLNSVCAEHMHTGPSFLRALHRSYCFCWAICYLFCCVWLSVLEEARMPRSKNDLERNVRHGLGLLRSAAGCGRHRTCCFQRDFRSL